MDVDEFEEYRYLNYHSVDVLLGGCYRLSCDIVCLSYELQERSRESFKKPREYYIPFPSSEKMLKKKILSTMVKMAKIGSVKND